MKKTILFLSITSLLYSCGGDKPASGTATNQTTDSSQKNTIAPPDDSLVRIKLAFVGDIMGHGDQIKSAFDPDTKTYDYEPCFRYIKPILERADIAFGNLELTTNNRGKYSGYPRFRSPDTLSYFLKEAGFDFLVTANNHSNDDDLQGVVHTLDVLDKVKMLHTGTFRNEAERTQTYPYLLEHKIGSHAFRFSIINYTYGTNGIPTTPPAVVNLIDTAQIIKDIQAARKQNPDAIIAIMHWGSEYQLNEHSTQQAVTKMLWRNGVDVVIGAHPHVIQPIKMDTVAGDLHSGKPRPVLVTYSLGNFISNQFQKNTDIGLIFELELEKNTRTGKISIADHHYVLAWRYIHNKGGNVHHSTHTILPSTVFEQDSQNTLKLSASTLNDMKSVSDRMRQHLNKWQGKERVVNKDEINLLPLPDK